MKVTTAALPSHGRAAVGVKACCQDGGQIVVDRLLELVIGAGPRALGTDRREKQVLAAAPPAAFRIAGRARLAFCLAQAQGRSSKLVTSGCSFSNSSLRHCIGKAPTTSTLTSRPASS
jgi:hypothetical protein